MRDTYFRMENGSNCRRKLLECTAASWKLHPTARPTSSANELCVLSLLQRDLALLVAAEVVHALLRHRDLDLAVAVEVYYALHLQSASVVLLWIVGHSDLWSRWPLSCPPRCWLLVPLGAAIVQPATPPPDPSCA